MKKSLRVFLPLLLALFFLTPTKAWADTANFSIKKVDTPEQTKAADFYDILAKPNQNTHLIANITNASDQQSTYTVTLRNGVTNDSGQIAYVPNTKKASGQTLNQLSPTAVKVTVPANSKKDVTIPIKMPATTYSGIILGAMHVEKETAQQKQTTKKAQIINHYGIEIPVVVRTTPSSTPDTKLQLKKVTAGLDTNKHSAVLATLYNESNWVLTPLKVDAKVYRKSNHKLLYSSHKKGLEMAPNSSFNYAIEPGDEPLKAGTYTLDMTAKSDKKTWHFSSEFTIKRATLKENAKNELKSPEKKKSINIIWLIVGFSILLLILIILYLLYKLRQKTKEQ
ncbi:cell surface protein [Latilactobacillus sakei]|uniref:DUF916 and DUF3324 domain-containing protein n=1 Tax=Latilactobacillus sakei TaxID=1599 RepID=UPI000334D64F|nr:DUF916 and DUF3324 domain-containing protein [Latilactobacillus sakei]AWZ45011.1 cell surface protein [Latilactobacillus sakei]EOR84085.1 cell surface protein [Latilactobacillus sakei subsp. sakei LS25]MCB4410219.1 DUF916 and DUF3324 domain-containing protein [Latilactobacillus sakei]PKX63274.1 DUF3324 domain-containing protein [Latilactobacillus sakei]PKX67361.1 DUF3324 domain-containing protein [Latilactobacillus sakei]